MMRFKKILLFPALIFITGSSIAQQSTQNNYRLVAWTANEGLSVDHGNLFLKDVNGFLWIGSPHGLNRFDGSNFKHYFSDKNKSGTIIGNYIKNLIEDSLHNIWVGTEKGLSRYDIKADTFMTFQPAVHAAHSFIIPFWATKNEVLCVEDGFTLTAYNTHSFTKKVLIKISPDYKGGPLAHAVYDAKSNCVWLLENANEQSYGRLFRVSLNDGKGMYYPVPLFNEISKYAFYPQQGMSYDKKRNAIWISSFTGLVEFTLNDKQFHHPKGLEEIENTQELILSEGVGVDINGNVWWCSWPAGPIIYNPSTQTFAPVFAEVRSQHRVSMTNLYIYCAPDGMVWTSCMQQSNIYQIIPASNPVVRYTADKSPHSLSGNFLNKIINADKGKLWIGQGDELNIFDPQTGFFELVSTEKDLPAFRQLQIIPVVVDSIHQKALFDNFSQKTGISELYVMDILTRQCHHVVFKDRVGQTISHPATSYYTLAYKGGAFFFTDDADKSNSGIFAVNTDSGLAQWVAPVPENLAGRFGTDNEHLLFIKCNNVEKNLTYSCVNDQCTKISSPLDSLDWTALYYDKINKVYWVGLNGEVICYDKNFRITHHYSVKNGLPEDAVTAILSDKMGKIWLQFKRDIFTLNIETGKAYRLSQIDGLTSQPYEFSQPVASGGDLYFWGGAGIDRINPGKLAEHYPPSSAYFKSLLINQKSFSLPSGVNDLEELSLHYFENDITIETGVIDYNSKGKSNIRYKLESDKNKNAEWQYEPAYYTIHYEQLPPANYKLIIQASNAANEFNGPEKTLLINISPEFWNTWWFRFIIIAIASYVIISIFRARIKKIQRDAFIQNQLKELEMKALKAQMNPHFIYNALNSIQALIANDKKEEGIHYIGSFSRLLRQVLDNSESNIISLDKELETIGLYIQMETLRLDMQLQYKKNIPKEVITEFEKTPPLILQPFVENALWHGLSRKQGKKEIEISVSVKDNWLLCDITDNGIGRAKAQEWKSSSAALHQSKGIEITRKRLFDFNEDDQVPPVEFFDLYDDNKNPCGTHVTVSIKRKSSFSLHD